MSIIYIGVRAELPGRIIKHNIKDVLKRYNAEGDSQILDLKIDGKITVEKQNAILIARGISGAKKGMINFALVIPSESEMAAERIAQIINVLGNNRLIRERVKTFIDGQSNLNNLPELQKLNNAFTRLEKYISGFIIAGWYYAPEIIFDENDNTA